MDRTKTGLMWRLVAISAAALLAGAATSPAGAQTILFQEPEITVVASEGNIDRMKELIQQRTHLDRQDSRGRTALVAGTIGNPLSVLGLSLPG